MATNDIINNTKPEETVVATSAIPRGVTVSGRDWKRVQTKRFSSQRCKSLRRGWSRQVQERERDSHIKAISNDIKNEKQRRYEQQKNQAIQRRLMKEENERKAEIVQKISSGKLKRMTKKQLRGLRRREQA